MHHTFQLIQPNQPVQVTYSVEITDEPFNEDGIRVTGITPCDGDTTLTGLRKACLNNYLNIGLHQAEILRRVKDATDANKTLLGFSISDAIYKVGTVADVLAQLKDMCVDNEVMMAGVIGAELTDEIIKL